MLAEIISIGNELLSGNTVNTNATFISKRLHEHGILTVYAQVVGDRKDSILAALKLAVTRADVVLLTGGLGPTHDDITKKVIAGFFNKKLIFDEKIYMEVKERFAKRGIPMPEINRNQALVPAGVQLMANPIGSAPGMIFRPGEKLIFVMPGVPREMKAMMNESVIPLLKELCPECQVKVDLFRTTGIPESAIYEKLEKDLPNYSSYEIAFLPKFTGVDLRIIRKKDDIKNEKKFQRFAKILQKSIGDYIYSSENIELEAVIGNLLREKQLSLSVAESITGGLIQDKITNISGSSEYFLGGVVVYSNEAKMRLLDVNKSSLQKFGAVSETVAREMVEGVRKKFGSDIAVSTTGIAGPTGATDTKPVGLVYIGISDKNGTRVKKYQFGNDRNINKARSAQAAIEMIRRQIKDLPI